MKIIIARYGLIAGLIVTAWMVGSVALCYSQENFEGNMLLGYASMVLAFSFIFVGIKKYRDNENGGFISFGKAFKIGLFISLIASTMYVVVWLVDYYVFIPDFLDKYTAHVLKQTQGEGVSQQDFFAKKAEMENFKQLYKNPLMVVLITYFEVLPVGIVISLISALLLKRKTHEPLQVA